MRDGFRKKIKEEKKRGKEDGWMKRGRGKEKKKKKKKKRKKKKKKEKKKIKKWRLCIFFLASLLIWLINCLQMKEE